MHRWFVLFAVGCSFPHPYEDIGEVCLDAPVVLEEGPDGEPTRIEASVVVELSSCSSGSTEWRDQTCDVEVVGSSVAVSTSGETKSPWQGGTDDCRTVVQPCGTVELDAGTWQMRYGAGSAEFAVRFDGEPPCVEADPQDHTG